MTSAVTAFPEHYESMLFEALNIQAGDEISEAILEPLFQFNRSWVKEGELMDYSDQAVRSYTLYYMTINMPKLWFLLQRSNINSSASGLRIAEFGCGPGTFIWALLFYWQTFTPDMINRIESIDAIDSSTRFLKTAETMQTTFGFENLNINYCNSDWMDKLDEDYDILIIGNSITENKALNPEIFSSIRAKTIIIIEPGTHASFQSLLTIRNAVMKANNYSIRFPCPNFAECPMTGTGNWCHFHINRFVLPFIQRISNKAKRLNARHHFSSFIFERSEDESCDHWRILSDLRRASRSGIRWLCDGESMIEVVLNRRDKADGNRDFLNAETASLAALKYSKNKTSFIGSKRLSKDDEFRQL